MTEGEELDEVVLCVLRVCVCVYVCVCVAPKAGDLGVTVNQCLGAMVWLTQCFEAKRH